MNNLENSQLILLSSVIPTNGANAYGYSSQFKQIIQWDNINMVSLLGTMYDKYDYFNLQLIRISAKGGDNVGCYNVGYLISGLQFVNNNYDIESKNNINKTYLASYKFQSSHTGEASSEYSNTFITFAKPNSMCNIKIEQFDLAESYDKLPPVEVGTVQEILPETTPKTYHTVYNNVAYPDLVFVFKIWGIPKYKADNDITNFNQSNSLLKIKK